MRFKAHTNLALASVGVALIGLLASAPAANAVNVPVVTPPIYCPPDVNGRVDPFPCSPSVVIGPGPLYCRGPQARLNNDTCPAVRVKYNRLVADNVAIGKLLRSKRGGCFNHWPSVVVTPPSGQPVLYRRCGRGRDFNGFLRSIRYSNNAYIEFVDGGIPQGAEPGV